MTISQTAAKAEAEAEAETEFSRLQVLLAELQATCAELHGAKSAHSLQVRTFYALNELSRLVTLVSAAQLKKVQAGIEKCLMELLNVGFAEACLTSRLHDQLRACWTLLYTHGEPRNILQVFEKLMAIVSKSAKSKTMAKTKTAAMVCMAALCRAQGRLLLGHLSDSIKLFGKMISSSSEPTIRKAAVFALGEVLESCGTGGAHAHIEALRFLKFASIDKSSFVRLSVGPSLVKLSAASNSFTTIALDQCASISKKGFEDPVFSVKLAFAQSFGVLVAQSALLNDAVQDEQLDASTSLPSSTASSSANEGDEGAGKRGTVSGLTGLSNLSTSLTRKRMVMKAYTTRSALDMFVQEIARASSRTMKIVYAFALTAFAHTLLEAERTEARAKRMMEGILKAAMGVAKLRRKARAKTAKTSAGNAFHFSQAKPPPASAFDSVDDPNWLHRSLACYILRECVEGPLSQRLSLELAGMLCKICIDTAGNSNIAPPLTRRASSSSSVGFSKKKKKRSKRKGLQWERSPDELIVACHHLARLLTSFADASLVLEEDLIELLPTLLEHPARRVRLEAGVTLYTAATQLPDLAPRLLLPMLQNLGTLHAEVAVAEATDSKFSSGSPDDAANTMLTMEGYINGICALIYASSARDGCAAVGEHTIVAVLGYAKALVARQHDGAVKDHASARCVSGGWALIGALVTQGPRWTLYHLGQLMRAWDVSFSSVAGCRGEASLTTLACVTSAAVALVTFSRCNADIISGMPKAAHAVAVFLRRITAVSQQLKAKSATERSLCVRLQSCVVELASLMPAKVLASDDWLMTCLLRLARVFICGKNSTTLLSEGGLLDGEEDVLNGTYPCNTTAVQDQAMDEGADPLGSQVWRFAIEHQPTEAFAALMNAVPLTSAEVLAHSASAMVWHTRRPHPGRIPALRISSRAVDASVQFFASAFAQLDTARQDAQLTVFVRELQAAEGTAKPVLARNVLAAMVMTLDEDTLQLHASWKDKARGILFAACASPQAIVRRASSLALGRIAQLDTTTSHSSMSTLVANVTSASSTYTKAGSLHAITYLTESPQIPMNLVYTACKQTAEPGKSWALHAWSRLLDTCTTDVPKYAKPTLALINAHLLADEDKDKAQRQIPSGHSSAIPLVALMRMINSLIANLGPEADIHRFADVWRALILVRWEPLQKECIRFVSQVAYLNASAFLTTNRHIIRAYIVDQLLPAALSSWPTVERQALALTALLRVAERDAEIAMSAATCSICFASFEAYVRRHLSVHFHDTSAQGFSQALTMQESIRATMVQLLHMAKPDAKSKVDEWLMLCLRIANGRVHRSSRAVMTKDNDDADADEADADAELFREEAKDDLALPVALREVSWQTRLLAPQLLCAMEPSRLRPQLDAVLKSACQLASMSISHTPVFSIQRTAVTLLQRVLESFATELTEYEVQLNASIRGCFAVGACAFVQQTGCNLLVRMLTSGLTQSTRRFLRLLLPSDDDDDGDIGGLEEEEPFESDASKARIAIARLDALAQLRMAGFRKPEGMAERTCNDVVKQIDSHLDLLVNDWTAVVRDYLLIVAYPNLLVMHPLATYEALFTIPEVQDAYKNSWFHVAETLVALAEAGQLGDEEEKVVAIVTLTCCAHMRHGTSKIEEASLAGPTAQLLARLCSLSKLTAEMQVTCLVTLLNALTALSGFLALRNKSAALPICDVLEATTILLASVDDAVLLAKVVEVCLTLVRQIEPRVCELDKLGFSGVRSTKGVRKVVLESRVLQCCLEALRAYDTANPDNEYRAVILVYAGTILITHEDSQVLEAAWDVLVAVGKRETKLLGRVATTVVDQHAKCWTGPEDIAGQIPAARLKKLLLLGTTAGTFNRSTLHLWRTAMRCPDTTLNLAAIQALEEVSKEGREDVVGRIGPELLLLLQRDTVIGDQNAQEVLSSGARLALRLCVMRNTLSKVVISTLAYLATQEVNQAILPLAKQCLLGLAQKRPGQFKTTVQALPPIAQAALRNALS